MADRPVPTPDGSNDPEALTGRRIGVILRKMGLVNRDQVHEALDLQSQRRLPLGQLLIELGHVNQADVNAALAAQAGMESVDLEKMELDESVFKILPAETAKAYQCIPIRYEESTNTLTIAMKSADNFRAMDDLQLLMGFDVKAIVADPRQIDACIARYYETDDESISSLLGEMADDETFLELQDRDESVDLEVVTALADDNKVKRLLNLVLLQAIKEKSSDIHFEPFEDEFKMRYRVDGVLYEMIPPPRHLAMPITSRIKVMAKMDIAERRLPQDGRVELVVAGNPIDLRVSVLPTIGGNESVVMRVLDRSNVQLDLAKLGLRDDDMETFRQLTSKPNGIVIVTGPTGSGKTTTLYAALSELNDIETKILTAEDPVEYDIDGLVQCQVNEEVGMTFARALRSFLRQDPDKILVGEVRDLETAEIAVQAALTGHLVLSTLHTNDAPSSIARLLDLGLEPFLVTATIEGIVAQRLVKRICPRCKESYEPTEEQLMELELTPEDVQGRAFSRGATCEYCNHIGYRGRVGIYEIMILDDDLRELIMQHASTQVIRTEARNRGMRTLRQSGMLAIYDGHTTIDEVVRETITEED
ncbi:MAG: pilus assembly protein PilB [Planctomycetaceae bacterium]|nr:pilus assembly protein PilB [Planctomycetaceae bacterium]